MNMKMIAPLIVGATGGAGVGAAMAPKGERHIGALQGAGLGTIIGGGAGATGAIASDIRKALPRTKRLRRSPKKVTPKKPLESKEINSLIKQVAAKKERPLPRGPKAAKAIQVALLNRIGKELDVK